MFRTADLVGLDTLVHIARNTAPLVKPDEADLYFTLPAFIEKMVEKKLLGNKTDAGFYKRLDKKKFQVIDPKTAEYRDQAGEKFEALGLIAFEPDPGKRIKALLKSGGRAGEFAWKVFAGTSVYAAERIPEIADTVVEIDNAMRWGFNFDLGPFEAWDAVGLKESIARMKLEGIKVPKKIDDMLKAKKTSFYKNVKGKVSYYDFKKKDYVPVPPNPNLLLLKSQKDQNKVVATCPTATLLDLGDGVFGVEFHSTMNALDEAMMKMMNTGVDKAEAEGAGLVIGNQTNALPGAFSAGANINVVLQGAKAGQFGEIERVVKYFQDTNQRLKYSSVPVVSTPHGLTLGGGAEVCMGSNQMIAAADLYMGMVEVGVGLIPGGGGCMNLLKQHQNFIPKQVVMDNLQPLVVPVFEMIAMAKTSNSAQEAREMGLLRPCDRIIFNRDHQLAAAKRAVLGMHLAGFKPPERAKIQVMGDSLRGAVDVVLYNMRQGNYASDYDVFIAKKLAWVLCGGDAREGTFVDEEELLVLEREVFVALCHEEKTQKRLEHMLMTGKPLRN
jgi:3-hydroxyacyl-CoA dehydrogenase